MSVSNHDDFDGLSGAVMHVEDTAVNNISEHEAGPVEMMRREGTQADSDVPFNVVIDLTNKCNLACKYCYFSGKGDTVIDRESASGAIDAYFPHAEQRGSLMLGFMGAEPLVAFDRLRELVEYAEARCKSAGIEFNFGATTNATLITPEVVDFCREHSGTLFCSCDGDEYSQNLNRPFKSGQGSFPVVDRNLDLVRPVSAGVRLTITPGTAQFLKDNLVYLARKGVAGVAAFPAVGPLVKWGDPDFENVFRAVGEIVEERLQGSLRRLKRLTPFDYFIYHAAKGIEDRAYGCGAGQNIVSVGVDGQIYLCHRLSGNADFSIPRGDLGDKHRARVLDNMPEECLSCRAFPVCGGGCWAQNYETVGQLNKPNPSYCRYVFSVLEATEQAKPDITGHEIERMELEFLPVSGENTHIITDFCGVCNCGCKCCKQR